MDYLIGEDINREFSQTRFFTKMIQNIFSWLSIVAFVIMAIIGVMNRSHKLLIAAIIVSLPNCLYLLGANNWIRAAAVLIPLSLLLSSYSIKRRWYVISKIVLIPICIFSLYSAESTEWLLTKRCAGHFDCVRHYVSRSAQCR